MTRGFGGREVGRLCAAASLVLAGVGCPAPPTTIARAREAAQEFNEDARFGRTEGMIDKVAAGERAEFTAQHREWGHNLRIADIEISGMHAIGDHELKVLLRVAWYRVEEQELHVTTVEQSWRDTSGWQLGEEKRADGDPGLLGEPTVYQSPGAREPARFPTVHLGGTPAE